MAYGPMDKAKLCVLDSPSFPPQAFGTGFLLLIFLLRPIIYAVILSPSPLPPGTTVALGISRIVRFCFSSPLRYFIILFSFYKVTVYKDISVRFC